MPTVACGGHIFPACNPFRRLKVWHKALAVKRRANEDGEEDA